MNVSIYTGTAWNGVFTVAGGEVDDVNKTMTITDSRYGTYKGTITQDKNFTGTYEIFPFSLSYMFPTGN